MRKNLPVTMTECPVPEGMLIVSKTDTKGKITFVNDTFLKISGFSEAEVMGEPHNLVRHPDMPVEAFEDMWTTLKDGQPWTGAVKNRCKNGDYYWVLATATPLKEKGQITGFMSVRRSLPQDVRDAVILGYKRFVDGKADGLKIEKGGFVGTSWFSRYKRATASVRMRMTKLSAQLGALFIVLGGLAAPAAFGGSVTGMIATAVAIVGLAVAFVAPRRLVGVIQRDAQLIKEVTKQIAEGDYSATIDVSRGGENGDILRYLKALQTKQAYDIEEKRVLTEKQEASMQKLANDFEQSVRGVVDAVSETSSELQLTAQSMSTTAALTSQQATTVAAASEQASNNVQTVATAGEELSASIQEISRQVSHSSQLTKHAVEQANQTNIQVEGLARAANSIGDVVKLISEIASQTNLLALNATIEAARAGEVGKGFAVVASEVKNLATQTAKATDEISVKIAEMQAATAESVKAIQSISVTIAGIDETATNIASAVEEQGAATQEISRNVLEAARGTQEVSANITEVTQGAADTGLASGQVLTSATKLAEQGDMLREKVDGFISHIRAAA